MDVMFGNVGLEKMPEKWLIISPDSGGKLRCFISLDVKKDAHPLATLN